MRHEDQNKNIKKTSIKDFRDRDFSEYCEYVTAFKLQELGWKVFQPLSDRYIDIVAYRKINNSFAFRTIQVKGSRIELEGGKPSYGLTHKPKDLIHSPSHFFVWLFYDQKENEKFVVLSVSNFIKLMGNSFFHSMSWRKGNCRIHFSSDLKKTKLKRYLNNWRNLMNGGNPKTYKLCINAQEIEDSWKTENAKNKWFKTNQRIIKKILPEMMKRIRRKIEIED